MKQSHFDRGDIFRGALALFYFSLSMGALIYHIKFITNDSSEQIHTIFLIASFFNEKLSNPSEALVKITTLYSEILRDALIAGFLGYASVRYALFLCSIPWREGLDKLRLRLAVELTKRGISLDDIDIDDILQGMYFVEGHPPSEKKEEIARMYVRDHYEELFEKFHYSANYLRGIRIGLFFTGASAIIGSIAFLTPFLYVIVIKNLPSLPNV
ncbi:MAG: hypothetical protein NPIRA01_29200 [Nitrospirales bacterium]|nr:MAG: hypothetical protein NPIRA01_29200 [Nitrospirales bacterium]